MAKFHRTREHDVLLELLKRERMSRGLSQNEVSRRLGRRENYMNRVEQGRHSLDVVGTVQILNAIGADAQEFFVEYVRAIAS